MEIITLDGRKFHCDPQDHTASQDSYILAHLRLAGAIEVLNDLEGIERSPEKRAEELLTQILLSGRTHFILAGYLTEAGKDWCRSAADVNAARFAAITDVLEKAEMWKSIEAFVTALLLVRGALSETLQRSSSRSAEVPPTTSKTLIQ
jgi:hypothetical protein